MQTKILTVSIEAVEPNPQISKAYVSKNLHGLELTMKMVGHLLEPVKVVMV